MMENDLPNTFETDLADLYISIRKFHEKHNLQATLIIMVTEEGNLASTSSFDPSYRVEFLRNTADTFEKSGLGDIVGIVPKFDN